MEKLFEDLEKIIDETGKALEAGLTDLGNALALEKERMDIRSQIGHHQRKINRTFANLGEAYYNFVNGEGSVEALDEMVDSISANKKVIELLEQQLAEKKDPVPEEEPVEEAVAEEAPAEEAPVEEAPAEEAPVEEAPAEEPAAEEAPAEETAE